jgi:hypothetical protein
MGQGMGRKYCSSIHLHVTVGDDKRNPPVSLSEGLSVLLSRPPLLPGCPLLNIRQTQGAVLHADNAFWQGKQWAVKAPHEVGLCNIKIWQSSNNFLSNVICSLTQSLYW